MSDQEPINNINSKVDDISTSMKNIRVDINVIRADIKLIKEALDKKEQVENISKGWWLFSN